MTANTEDLISAKLEWRQRGLAFEAAFPAQWLSSHPGTASMGRLLMISLGWELLVTLLFRPALPGRPSPK
jgi:hypothetical protein